MKNKSALQSILTGLFAVLVLAASNSVVRAQNCPSTTWIGGIGGTGDWFTAGNWSGCVPNITTDAYINNRGTAQILGGPDHATTQSLTLGDNQGDSGNVAVDGASAVLDVRSELCGGNIYMGYRGSGTMQISNGAKINSRYGYIAAVANPSTPSSNGKVTLVGSGTQWNLEDNAGNGCPGAGLFIGCTASSDVGGTALVDVEYPASIYVVSSANAPGVKVGPSGTLTGNGILNLVIGSTLSSQTAVVLGTLAPAAPAPLGALAIIGNLELRSSATTAFNVTPQTLPTIAQVAVSQIHAIGGNAYLNGRISVTVTGNVPYGDYTLLNASASLNGFFSSESINTPGCLRGSIRYDANNVYLHLEYICDE
jgi:T5SS/PEP-CTERM-associated repeat protein